MGKITVGIEGSNPLTASRGSETDIYPLNLPNLEVWYDGSDANMFTLNGVKVSQWDDKSGNSRHLYQAVDGSRPDYDAANNRVTFDRTAPEFLKSADWTLNQDLTIYLKYQLLSEGGSIQYMFDVYNLVLNRISFYETGFDSKIKGSIGGTFTMGDYDTNERVIAASIDETDTLVNFDDSVVNHSGSAELDGITLGTNYSNAQGISGHIKQVLVYSLAHSQSTINQVKTWLSGK